MRRSQILRSAFGLNGLLFSMALAAAPCEYKATMSDEEMEACRHPAAPIPIPKGATHQRDSVIPVVAGHVTPSWAAAPKYDAPQTDPHVGMTAEDASKQLQEWCSRYPKINRTTSARGTSEQWVCGAHDGRYLYFENGILTSIQE